MLRENAQAQRVADEQQTVPQQHPTSFPVLEVEDSHSPGFSNTRGTPIISQDYDESPAHNTRQQRVTRTLTQDYMLHMMEIPSYQAPFTPAQAAARRYHSSSYATLPMQSWTMTLGTFLSTVISSSTLNTRTHGASHLEKKSDA